MFFANFIQCNLDDIEIIVRLHTHDDDDGGYGYDYDDYVSIQSSDANYKICV